MGVILPPTLNPNLVSEVKHEEAIQVQYVDKFPGEIINEEGRGKIFYTKCGRIFKKQSTASTTGYEISNDDVECAECPFKEKIQRMRNNEYVTLIECRAGEKVPNKNNDYRAYNMNDTTSLSIYSLDYRWLEKIKSETLDMKGVESCYYTQDLNDCRKALSVGFKKNKTGIKAKGEIVSKYFNK